MNSEMTASPAVTTPDNALAFWRRFRTTFGPALIGALGGGLTVGIACTEMLPVLRNVAATYHKFPSLPVPWPACDFAIPAVVLVPLVVIGALAPFAMGLATVRLARPNDRWEVVSAGVTAAVTGSAVAYMSWIGWVVTLSMVVVPSIADLTLLANSTRTPVEATGFPSDVLATPYPDLKGTPADERGGLFFPKIVSDQVVGSAYAVWYGAVASAVLVGLPCLCGTWAAAWLWRRGGARHVLLFSYAELTVVTSVTLGVSFSAIVGVGFPLGHVAGVFRFATLAAFSAVVVAGVIGRWEWPLRVTAAACWGLVLFGAGFAEDIATPTTVAASGLYGGLGALLGRHWWLRSGTQPPVASATRLVMPPK